MNLSELRTLTRKLVNEPSNTALLTNDEVDRFLNIRYSKVLNEILDINETYFGAIDTTIDLVNGTQSYDLPDLDSDNVTRILRIRRLEIAYDGTNFYKALPIDIAKLPDTNWQQTYYTVNNPRYYLLSNTLYLLPTPTANATNALKIWYIQRQTELSGDSAIPAFPATYHNILAYGAAADIKKSEGSSVVDTDDEIYIQQFERDYKDGLEQLTRTMQPRDVSSARMVTDVSEHQNYDQLDFVEPGSMTI